MSKLYHKKQNKKTTSRNARLFSNKQKIFAILTNPSLLLLRLEFLYLNKVFFRISVGHIHNLERLLSSKHRICCCESHHTNQCHNHSNN